MPRMNNIKNKLKKMDINTILGLLAVCLVLGLVFSYMKSNSNFENFTDDRLLPKDSNSKTFVMFYADWCPHCVNAKPHFNKLKQTVSKKFNNKCSVVMIDAEENTKLSETYNVAVQPTFKLIDDKGNTTDYESAAEHDNFVEFLSDNL